MVICTKNEHFWLGSFTSMEFFYILMNHLLPSYLYIIIPDMWFEWTWKPIVHILVINIKQLEVQISANGWTYSFQEYGLKILS